MDQVYWGDRNPAAENAWCDGDCQGDPNREAVMALQLQGVPPEGREVYDPTAWAAGEATAKGKGVEVLEAATAIRAPGRKDYELTDHLGNVRVVVTDRKLSTLAAAVPVDFEAQVVVMRDHYVFGMQMPGQQYALGEYRFGFNGKESDDEWNGEGNMYNYGFRIHDPRLGRFLSVDPFAPEYPWYTPYQYAGNTPIQAIDLDGLEEWIVTVDQFGDICSYVLDYDNAPQVVSIRHIDTATLDENGEPTTTSYDLLYQYDGPEIKRGQREMLEKILEYDLYPPNGELEIKEQGKLREPTAFEKWLLDHADQKAIDELGKTVGDNSAEASGEAGVRGVGGGSGGGSGENNAQNVTKRKYDPNSDTIITRRIKGTANNEFNSCQKMKDTIPKSQARTEMLQNDGEVEMAPNPNLEKQ